MVSRSNSYRLVPLPALLVAIGGTPAAQAPAPTPPPPPPPPPRPSFPEAVRAQAVVGARQADSAIAAELVGLAEAQRAAGVSPAIDVTRAQAQLARAQGLLLVAKNQLDRGRIDVTRALGLDPATPLTLTDSLAPSLGAADVSVRRDSARRAPLANRPDLRAQQARAPAARPTPAALRAERPPPIEGPRDHGANGPTAPHA